MAPGVVDVTPMLPERPYAPFRRYQSTYNPTVRLYYQIHTKRVSIALLKMTRVSVEFVTLPRARYQRPPTPDRDQPEP